MSHHWREWRFTHPLGQGYRRSSIGTHKVAVMVEAERIAGGGAWSGGWAVSKEGRTVCGLPISTPDSLAPNGMPRTDPFECWVSGWRPCSRCFPEFDLKTWKRIRALELFWWSKGREDQVARLDYLLWRIVYARRDKADAA